MGATIRKETANTANVKVRCHYRGKETTFPFEAIGSDSAQTVAEEFCSNYRLREKRWRAGGTVDAWVKTKLDMIYFLGERKKIDGEEKKELKVRELVDLYLKHRASRIRKPGQKKKKNDKTISPGSYQSDYDRLRAHLLPYLEERGITFVKKVNSSDFISDYRDRALEKCAKRGTARHVVRTLTAMLRWGTRYKRDGEYLIKEELPRDISDYAISADEPDPKWFEVGELHALIQTANKNLLCHILLALNCAMTEQDISDLTYNELDLEEGMIRRGRSKTTVYSEYKLWPETIDALKKTREKRKSGPVLLSKNGNRLVYSQPKKTGGFTPIDSIKSAFYRLRRKLNLDPSFIALKKTTARTIEHHPDFIAYPWLASKYLAHTEGKVSNDSNEKVRLGGGVKQHYTSSSFALLAQATDATRETLKIKEAYENSLTAKPTKPRNSTKKQTKEATKQPTT